MTENTGDNVGGVARERLNSFITRVERLVEERDTLNADIREVFSEAKSAGFDPKIMREVIRRRKMETADREAHDALRDMYEQALGVWG